MNEGFIALSIYICELKSKKEIPEIDFIRSLRTRIIQRG